MKEVFVLLNKEDAIRIELVQANKCKYRLYFFKCLSCPNEVKSRATYLKTHSGLCRACSSKKTIKSAQKSNRLKPFEARYRIFLSKIKNEPVQTDVTYGDYLKYTKIDSCHYCDKYMDWQPYDNNPGFWLDRKNNDLYHTKDNLVVCCGDCNKTKRDYFTYEEFMLLSPVLEEIIKNRGLNKKKA